MSILKKILYTSTVLGMASVLAPAISSSANARRTVKVNHPRTVKVVQHRMTSRKPVYRNRVAHPVYGVLKHDYTNWTLNGKYPMWTKPKNAGKRYQVMTRQQVRYAASHASNHAHNHEPKKYIFFLDDTATYGHHKYPAYFYMSSSDSNLQGWVYTKGIRQVGPSPYGTSIRVIHGNGDIYSPTQNHLTKHDYNDAKDFKSSLIYDVLNHDWSDYSYNLTSYRWNITHIGKRNQSTRIKQHKLMNRAIRNSWKVINHARRSKSFLHHLRKIDAYNIDD